MRLPNSYWLGRAVGFWQYQVMPIIYPIYMTPQGRVVQRNRWFHKAKHKNYKQQFVFWLISLGYLYDALVSILSLGFFHSEVGIYLLLDVFEDD